MSRLKWAIILVCAPIGVFTGQGALGQTTNWTDGDSTNYWSEQLNWSFNVPGPTTDATHLSSTSDAKVNTASATCRSFEGDAKSPTDRFLVIGQGDLLTIGAGGLTGTTGLFPVHFEDGTLVVDAARLVNNAAAFGIQFQPARTHAGNYASITNPTGGITSSNISFPKGDNGILVVGNSEESFDVIDTPLEVRDGWDVDVWGNLDAPASVQVWKIRNGSAIDIRGYVDRHVVRLGQIGSTTSSPTIMTVGGISDSLGGPTDANADWYLFGTTNLVVSTAHGSGHFIGADDTHPVVTMTDTSNMTVQGLTDWALWDMRDQSEFTGQGLIRRGTWNLSNTSEVIAQSGIEGGAYVLQDTAGVSVTNAISADFTMEDGSTVTAGSILDGQWLLSDSSRVATGAAVGGVWLLKHDAECVASGDVVGGTWDVDGKAAPNAEYNIDVADEKEFNPDALIIIDGRVHCNLLGFDRAGDQGSSNHPDWDMELRGNTEVVVDGYGSGGEGWHEGWTAHDHPTWQGGGSELRYDGVDNKYSLINAAQGIQIGGPIKQLSSNAEMTIDIEQSSMRGYLSIEAEPVSTVRGTGPGPQVIDFETEGVTVHYHGAGFGISGGDLEALSPDHDRYWSGSARVIFTDSPCVRRWRHVHVSSTGKTTLIDQDINSPISGGTDAQGTPPDEWTIKDAVYVIDLTVDAGSTLRTAEGIASQGPSRSSVNVYYTGTLTCETDPQTTLCINIEDIDNQDYQPIRVIPTTYGDFDGDRALNDSDDAFFFNSHFPTTKAADWPECGAPGSPSPCCNENFVKCYNPLVDADCDGDVDCDDRQRFLDNWPGANLDCGNCCGGS